MRRLEVTGNRLEKLAVPPLPSLEELLLQDSKLTRLDGMLNLPSLRLLNVDRNSLTSLSDITDALSHWQAAAATQAGSAISDAGDSNIRPFVYLAVLSVAENELPEDSWINVDGLAPIVSLRVRQRPRRFIENGFVLARYRVCLCRSCV